MKNFGTTSKGEKVTLYTLENKNHMKIAVTDYGAALVQLWVPDQNGKPVDVVLGYDDVTGYEKGTVYIGATVGRVANRIQHASFELNGKTYTLEKNDNGNTLHGGRDFMNQRMWEVKKADTSSILFQLDSPDGDQGYPGAVSIQVSYTLTDENELVIHYYAIPEEDTLLNLTNHSYFNLSGHDSGDVLTHRVMINADAFTKADQESIPTGEIVTVEGTPMDFRVEKEIGTDIKESYEALIYGNGYDHNWVLNGSGFRKVASVCSEETGIAMEIYTDLPGMQFYTANYLENESGKDGVIYGKRCASCFETQYFPDAIHKDNFEKPIVRANEVYDTRTVYKFI